MFGISHIFGNRTQSYISVYTKQYYYELYIFGHSLISVLRLLKCFCWLLLLICNQVVFSWLPKYMPDAWSLKSQGSGHFFREKILLLLLLRYGYYCKVYCLGTKRMTYVEGQRGKICYTVVHCCCQMRAMATIFVNDKETINSTSYVPFRHMYNYFVLIVYCLF